MTDSTKKRPENSDRRLFGSIAVIVTALLLIYGVSILVGGDFRDFCENAVFWVLAGVGIAAWFGYFAGGSRQK